MSFDHYQTTDITGAIVSIAESLKAIAAAVEKLDIEVEIVAKD